MRAALTGVLIALLALVILFWFTARGVFGQEHQGHHGRGHDKWHELFYRSLQRPDTKGSCCNLTDCMPTQSRQSPHGYYEVMLEGRWVLAPRSKILPVTAPDWGAHVCAPKNTSGNDIVYCVVLPPEG